LYENKMVRNVIPGIQMLQTVQIVQIAKSLNVRTDSGDT
jgi:hypothetical protein